MSSERYCHTPGVVVVVVVVVDNFRLKFLFINLKGRIVQPPKTGLKCTSAAAPTLQQTVACQSCPLSQVKVSVY